MLYLTHNIIFTKKDAIESNCHSDLITKNIANSETISNIINFKYSSFPNFNIVFWEVKEERFIFAERFKLTIVINSLFSEN